MNRNLINRWMFGWIIGLACAFSVSQSLAQQTTAFTYQGQLRDGGTNANGTYMMIFKLYDTASSGNQIGSAITDSPTLANGLFSVNLDFGAGAFNGSARWLDITVTNGPDTQTLTPRVQVLPSPYALYAAVAATVTNGAIMNAQLAANAVATANIQDNAVTTAKIADGAVTNRNLAANAVATANIQGNSVTDVKIVSVSGAKVSGTVATASLANSVAVGSVSNSSIASGQVVKSLNGLTDDVILAGGTNVTLTTNGNVLQISVNTFLPNMQVFDASGTFVVPAGVSNIMVEIWGGGGGGLSVDLDNGNNGGGGAGGGYGKQVINVTPGSSHPVVVGDGGYPDSSGGDSSFDGLIAHGGGRGGSCNATLNITGGDGGAIFGWNDGPAGNGGAAGCGGLGGTAATIFNGGSGQGYIRPGNGKVPGGGGGGDIYLLLVNTGPGYGAHGRVVVYY
jgi:predicted outer membrane lipoprotein